MPRTNFQCNFVFLFLDLSALSTDCRKEIQWAYKIGRNKNAAESWYGDMKNVIGVGYKKANIYDFVQFFKCKGTKAKKCHGIFWPEGRCTNPPCNKCQGKSSR